MTQQIRGVALVVKNPQGQILILQELQSKPRVGKYAGMFSIPMETCEPGESDHDAMIRLAKEELPPELHLPPFEGILQSHVGAYQIVREVWVNLYSATVESAELPCPQDSERNEVGNHQWMGPMEALGLWLRQGAWEMIKDFLVNSKGVRREHCQAPAMR